MQAAQELENEHGIHTNLYLVSGLLHAAACAEAGATTITIPVGRVSDPPVSMKCSKVIEDPCELVAQLVRAETEGHLQGSERAPWR